MKNFLKIINILLVIFSFALLLTPWFVASSKGFDWGFSAFMGVTVPLIYCMPLLLLVQMVLLVKAQGKKLYWWVLSVSVLIYLSILWYVLAWA